MRGYPADPDRKRNCLINYFLGIHFLFVCVFENGGPEKYASHSWRCYLTGPRTNAGLWNFWKWDLWGHPICPDYKRNCKGVPLWMRAKMVVLIASQIESIWGVCSLTSFVARATIGSELCLWLCGARRVDWWEWMRAWMVWWMKIKKACDCVVWGVLIDACEWERLRCDDWWRMKLWLCGVRGVDWWVRLRSRMVWWIGDDEIVTGGVRGCLCLVEIETVSGVDWWRGCFKIMVSILWPPCDWLRRWMVWVEGGSKPKTANTWNPPPNTNAHLF